MQGDPLPATFDPEDWAPVVIGPTWTKDETGESYVLPEHTLGWEAALFAAKYLKDPKTGAPWEFTMEQLRFILWYYALNDDGEFIYRRAVLQRLKGWGKDREITQPISDAGKTVSV